MDQNYNHGEKRSSERFIDRIISKLGIMKRRSQSTITWDLADTSSSTSNNMETPRATDTDICTVTSLTSFEEDNRLNQRVSLTNVPPFCNQLQKFINYIKSNSDLYYFTYEYPNIIQKHLNSDVHELENMLQEVKSALVNIEKLKLQQKLVKKEKVVVKKTLKGMREDEIREMESIVSLYDKVMFSRWESIRNTNKSDLLEGMLTDIKCKQLALENLSNLVSLKLEQLEKFFITPQSSKEKYSLCKDKVPIPLPFPSFTQMSHENSSKIPPPPPMPPSLSSLPLAPPSFIPVPLNLSKNKHVERLSMERRRRNERREEMLERRYLVANNIDDLPLMHLTLNDMCHGLVGTVYPTIINNSSNSTHDVSSASSSSNAITRSNVNGVHLASINNDNEFRNVLGNEFHNEMQTVLQALFGDLRTSPPSLAPNDSSSNATTESVDGTNIELYTLEKP